MAELIHLQAKKKPQPTYPPNHKPAMRVPEGGSSCSSCEYLSDDEKHCKNKYFKKWHGTDILPAPANIFCSDWYEPAK